MVEVNRDVHFGEDFDGADSVDEDTPRVPHVVQLRGDLGDAVVVSR